MQDAPAILPPAARSALFLLLALATLTPWITAPVALAGGMALALLGVAAFESQSRKAARLLIQVSIVLLGFRMDLREVARAGLTGVLFAAGTILATFALGYALGRALRTEAKLTTLLSAGTAICGGSAIAATGAVIGAAPAHMSVAIGVVFLLNAAGLYLFPPLGHALDLSATQFGTWAAVAIHDVSSVVGAASFYDGAFLPAGSAGSLETATAVKLSRTLWIVPVATVAGWAFRRAGSRAMTGIAGANGQPGESVGPTFPVPLFIVLFVLASCCRTAIPDLKGAAPTLEFAARKGMTLALFLIGAGLSRKAIASVGWRALVQAVTLWLFITLAALVVVRATVD